MSTLQEIFRLKLPIIVAPMAGGISTPELVAASSRAGALGCLGAAYQKASALRIDAEQVKAKTDRPFAINLFAPMMNPCPSKQKIQRAREALQPYFDLFQLAQPEIETGDADSFEDQFVTVLEVKPAASSFVFGLIEKGHLRACRDRQIFTIGTATTFEEAGELQELGAQAIVLQGVEAGGHRGTFSAFLPDPGFGTFELLAQCAGKFQVPLIAAGGIMDGAQIRRALTEGAQAVQMGTAFLTCDEAGTAAPYRQVLLERPQRSTRVTRVYSGRLARGLVNGYLQEMETQRASVLPFPLQNNLTRGLRKASLQQGTAEFASLWAGTGAPMVRPMTVADLIETLRVEISS